MDRRHFSDRIKAYCGTEPNDKALDLSRGKAGVKSLFIVLRSFVIAGRSSRSTPDEHWAISGQ
jgi:hypothetical protein